MLKSVLSFSPVARVHKSLGKPVYCYSLCQSRKFISFNNYNYFNFKWLNKKKQLNGEAETRSLKKSFVDNCEVSTLNASTYLTTSKKFDYFNIFSDYVDIECESMDGIRGTILSLNCPEPIKEALSKRFSDGVTTLHQNYGNVEYKADKHEGNKGIAYKLIFNFKENEANGKYLLLLQVTSFEYETEKKTIEQKKKVPIKITETTEAGWFSRATSTEKVVLVEEIEYVKIPESVTKEELENMVTSVQREDMKNRVIPSVRRQLELSYQKDSEQQN